MNYRPLPSEQQPGDRTIQDGTCGPMFVSWQEKHQLQPAYVSCHAIASSNRHPTGLVAASASAHQPAQSFPSLPMTSEVSLTETFK